MESLPPEMHTAMLVTGLHQLVALDRHDEGGPQFFAIFFDDAAFDQLIGFQSLCFMGYPLFYGWVSSAVAGIESL